MKSEIKYAPTNLSEVVYPNDAVRKRISAYAAGHLEGNIILHGLNGTGKSTIARLLPNAIVGAQADIEDDDFDVLLSRKDLKDHLQRICMANKFGGQGKVFLVFEEFDNAKITPNKLWTAMDKCAAELQVIISTNHLHKVHRSVRDRCDCIEIGKANAGNVLQRAQHILNCEGLSLPDQYVLGHLQKEDWRGSIRGYMRLIDELLACQAMGLPMPAAHTGKSQQPNFTVLTGSNK